MSVEIAKKREKEPYIKIITVCATVIDIGCTFGSLGIIISNDLINEIGNLYNHNCYSDETVEHILSLKQQLSQVLISDGLEAALDFLSLIILCIGVIAHIELCQQIADSIHGVLFAMDWLLVTVNFFAFVLPSYNSFVQIYDNDDLLCYKGVNFVK